MVNYKIKEKALEYLESIWLYTLKTWSEKQANHYFNLIFQEIELISSNKQIDGVKGYSPQNLWRMRQFYLEYKGKPELLNLATKIPWGQNLLIMHQIKDSEERKYYLTATDKFPKYSIGIEH